MSFEASDWIVREDPETGEIWLEHEKTGETCGHCALEAVLVEVMEVAK